jgi:hypothetical protein
MPSLVLADVSSHLDTFTQPDPDALVFTSPYGMPLRHTNFRRRVWLPACAATGLSIHLHDLRHTGNQLVEVSGVASAASFSSFCEWRLPAEQRAALEQPRSHRSACTLRDLGCHHPPASSQTMMQPVRLQRITE